MTAPSPAASSSNGRIHTPVPDGPLRTPATSQPQVLPFSFTMFCPFLIFLGIILGTFTNPGTCLFSAFLLNQTAHEAQAPSACRPRATSARILKLALWPSAPTASGRPGSSVSYTDGFAAALRTTLLDNHLLPAFCFSFPPFSFKRSQNQGHTPSF